MCEHLHIQGVIRIYDSSAQWASRHLREYLGWKKDYGKIMMKGLTGKRLHTFIGMIGYCLKDEGQPYFKTEIVNISQAEMRSHI